MIPVAQLEVSQVYCGPQPNIVVFQKGSRLLFFMKLGRDRKR